MNDFDKHRYFDSSLWERYKTASLKQPDQCPDDIELAAFIEGSLPAKKKESIEAHLAVCDNCLDMVIEISMQTTEKETPAQKKSKKSRFKWKHLVYDFSFRWLAPAVATIFVIMLATQFGSLTFKNQRRMHVAVLSSISFGLNITGEPTDMIGSEDVTGGVFR